MSSLQCRLLRKAAELAGGVEMLRHELQVPAEDLERWMAGIEPMPRAVFLGTVDLIIELAQMPPEQSISS
jgi:hypothetical protein